MWKEKQQKIHLCTFEKASINNIWKLTHYLSLIRFDSFRDYKNQHSSQTNVLEINLIVWAIIEEWCVRGWYTFRVRLQSSVDNCVQLHILTLLYVWLLASAPGSCLMCSREYLSANHSDGNQFLESHCNSTYNSWLGSQSTHPHHHHYVISFLYF